MNCHRRDFLKWSAGALIAGLTPMPALAAMQQPNAARRRIALYNTHTGESLDVCYYDRGNYRPEALDRLNHILRDHRSGQVHDIDPRLLDNLYVLSRKIGRKSQFHIISGYRSPETNAMLRKQTSGVARTSFHTKGRAIDIRIPGYSSQRLRNACIAMKSGGVGYYADSNFVHMDTGPVRCW